MAKIDLNDFYNDGFGWVCKHCERELMDDKVESAGSSRLMREGEAESKNPTFSNSALAKWADQEQKTLMCRRCGITESVEKF